MTTGSDLGEQPPAVAATYLTGTTLRPAGDSLDWVFGEYLLRQAAKHEMVTARAQRYERLADAISEALAHHDHWLGMAPATPDPDAEMAKYQREGR